MKGALLGDMGLKNAVVEEEVEASDTRFFDDAVFRIVPKLNYRARSELHKTKKLVLQADEEDRERTKEDLGFALCLKRAKNEAEQNAESLARLEEGLSAAPIKYGDVVQLQHRKSGLFMAVHKGVAAVNPNCRRVSLKEGSNAAQFVIEPRFKVVPTLFLR